jgi:Leucine-rich repeat (LRR) protein
MSSIFLEGTLPTQMGLLSNCKRLILTNMFQLTGNLPSEFVNLSQLSVLMIYKSFYNEDIDFPTFISRLPASLTLLIIQDSRFISTIPGKISLLRNLTDLSLSNLTITGTVPSEIGLMTQLQKIELNDLMMEGSIPSEIGKLTHLTKLNFENSNLEKSLPQELSQLSSLQVNGHV